MGSCEHAIERRTKELKRRSAVVGIFPNRSAVLRLFGALLAEQVDDWLVGKRSFSEGSLRRMIERATTSAHAALPERIDALESEREQLYLALTDPALLRDGAAVAETRAKLTALEQEITEATERWEALETIAAGQ